MVVSHTRLLPLLSTTLAVAVTKPTQPLFAASESVEESCTSTTVVPAHDAPVPPETYEPTWTITKYTTTATVYTGVDCAGCAFLQSDIAYINYIYPDGPSPPAITTATATEPQTITEAHCTGAATGDGARSGAMPPPPAPRAPMEDEDCTAHVLAGQQFTHGPIKTVWTSTTTVTSPVDCGTCKHVMPSFYPIGPGPVIFFTSTVTATEPTTVSVPVCATGTSQKRELGQTTKMTGTSSYDYYEAPPFSVRTATPTGPKPSCTSQFVLDAHIPDSTSTVYGSTVTSTSSIDCGGCEVEWYTGVVNFFAPVLLTSTITAAEPSTSTVVACADPTA
jgi:hypothetical protein